MNLQLVLICSFASLYSSTASSSASPLVDWDFAKGAHGWVGNERVETVRSTSEGLVVKCLGADPWIEGPRFDAPTDAMLRVTLTMKTDTDGSAQFFYGRTFVPGRLVTFPVVSDGQWHTYPLLIHKSTGRGTRLRLDPCDRIANVVVQRIRVEAIKIPPAPQFAKPAALTDFETRHSVRAGPLLRLDHHPKIWNGLRLRFGELDLATGYDGELIGVMIDDEIDYLKLKDGKLLVDSSNNLTVSTSVRDSRGGTWSVTRRFMATGPGEAIEVETTISVDEDRKAVLLPWLTLLPGHGSYGARKHQGLFAGLEYLSDEPSSSKADLTGPDHLRRVPDPVKITMPLMAVAHDGHYVGLLWDKSEPVAAGFDSPDRVFGSDGHAMWLSGPQIGPCRFANDMVAHTAVPLQAKVPMKVRAVIIGGRSATVVGAVQQYLAMHPLPPLPELDGGYQKAVDLLAHGWLDSAIRQDWQFKHAEWMGRFPPQPAVGPAMFLSWLGQQTTDAELARRLQEGAKMTLAQAGPGDPYTSAVSHVRLPATPLVFGRIPAYVAQRKREALAQLGQFDSHGKILYRPAKHDFAKTHFQNHANGIGGRVIADILEAATLCADDELIARALAILDKQTMLYAGTVPRGAQTWEIPLHTPDILASAHLVRAYLYGYLLSANKNYLEQARYWAWTGVPFVYLVNPTGGKCGPYATIAVLGATNWVAPVWLGQPVQWCGLVYASALHLLGKVDSSGPWKQLASGITRAGLQMTWPTTDQERQGLLPDFFHLASQVSDGPAINPGTAGAHLPEAFGKGKIYDFHRFANGWIAHAPCAIAKVEERGDRIQFELAGWGDQSYHLLLAGVDDHKPVDLRVNGESIEVRYHSAEKLLIATLRGPARISCAGGPP